MSSSSSSSRNNRHHNSNRQDFDDRESSNNKMNDSNENIVHIKFLLPGPTTGSVIGKGGERIASLQKETNTKMKMSKAGDYFPGTQERVCLVIGTISNVLSVYEVLSDKIKETFPNDLIRSRQIKLIIPNATAGVIIGKGGSTIENIKQDTNALLTITPKSDMPERVMTITGEDEIRIKALEIVLEKVLEDPHHDSLSSVNYTNDRSLSINSSSIQNDIQPYHDPMLHGKMNGLVSMNSSSNMSIQLSGLQRLSQLIINAGGTTHMSIDSLVRSLQSLGFIEPQIREIVQSMTTLINYGLITIENSSRTNIYSPTNSNNHHSIFSTNHNAYSLPQRDRQDTHSRNSIDMDYKRFKSDQQRTNKTKR